MNTKEVELLREACHAAISSEVRRLGQFADHDPLVQMLRHALWPKGAVPPSKVAPGEPDPRD